MAPIIKIAALLNLSLYVAAQGTQFITGACTSDADCASACCGFNSGKCAGAVVAQERDGGCGFGDAQPNDNAAKALTGGASSGSGNANAQAAGGAQAAGATVDASSAAGAAAPAATSAASAGNGQGTQFITGACTSDADCASACCGFKSGKCAGAVVAQERDGGCGFGDAQPNDNAAQALTGGNGNANANGNAQAQGGNAQAQGAQATADGILAPATAAAPAQGQSTAAAGGASAGNGAGKQFITGACSSDADCASACCGFKSGKCAGAVVAQERDGGCGFGDAQPNDNAAKALQGRSLGKTGPAYM